MDTTFHQRIGAAVNEDRLAAEMSVNALSIAAKVSYATLTRRLAGEPFKVDELERIGEALGQHPSRWVRAAERIAS